MLRGNYKKKSSRVSRSRGFVKKYWGQDISGQPPSAPRTGRYENNKKGFCACHREEGQRPQVHHHQEHEQRFPHVYTLTQRLPISLFQSFPSRSSSRNAFVHHPSLLSTTRSTRFSPISRPLVQSRRKLYLPGPQGIPQGIAWYGVLHAPAQRRRPSPCCTDSCPCDRIPHEIPQEFRGAPDPPGTWACQMPRERVPTRFRKKTRGACLGDFWKL